MGKDRAWDPETQTHFLGQVRFPFGASFPSLSEGAPVCLPHLRGLLKLKSVRVSGVKAESYRNS